MENQVSMARPKARGYGDRVAAFATHPLAVESIYPSDYEMTLNSIHAVSFRVSFLHLSLVSPSQSSGIYPKPRFSSLLFLRIH